MGIEMALMATIAAGAEFGKMTNEYEGEKAEEAALNTQAKEQHVRYQQKSLNNLDAVQKVIEAQMASMTVRGTAFSSPSFNAIQRATLNIGAKKQKNIDTEESIADQNIKTEKENVRQKLYAQLFGDVSQTALNAMSIATKIPTMGS